MSQELNLNENQAREEIVKWAKEIYERGLVNGSGGNISIRISEDIILTTPSGWSLGHLSPESISKVNMNGEALEGPKPTKELPMHLAVYKVRADVRAIVHTHSIYAVTYASTVKAGSFMPLYTPSIIAKVGMVKILPFCLPGSQELGSVVAERIKEHEAVLLENHGVMTVGKNLETAVIAAFEVEDNAKVYFLSEGKARPIPESLFSIVRGKYK
ncbi:MAG: 3-dehydro-4-phosphotetronate decarboxylase [Epulopiscium sp.]|jgi:L-ribulose-5-phosphate 4-epimerase|nr:3-dehydro-4-phosphotetronate decarboxylase [Thermoanaerobacter sp.]MDK2788256.1 3-dehydro-4-phosphotetronate decarboxylase [Candidatus Epulonipiscium sp.]MDK2824795.1 3-dehydro-4-phosphotetronate decarboxylase [Clostridia bacterium]MDK2920353.1 3-dehydro-4-phosphotetronate decarboxylase [Candidatus Petromonas sp.]